LRVRGLDHHGAHDDGRSVDERSEQLAPRLVDVRLALGLARIGLFYV
jgi:hypothetical protein